MSQTKLPGPKRTWLKPAKDFYKSVIDGWQLSPEDIPLLVATCERLNSFWECQKTIDEDGMSFQTSLGEIKKHPLLATQKDCWTGYLQGVRALDLTESTDKRRPGRPIGSGLKF